MNQIEKENAIESIYGYFFPSPTKQGGNKEEFLKAKEEVLYHMKNRISHIENICFDDFAKGKIING